MKAKNAFLVWMAMRPQNCKGLHGISLLSETLCSISEFSASRLKSYLPHFLSEMASQHLAQAAILSYRGFCVLLFFNAFFFYLILDLILYLILFLTLLTDNIVDIPPVCQEILSACVLSAFYLFKFRAHLRFTANAIQLKRFFFVCGKLDNSGQHTPKIKDSR